MSSATGSLASPADPNSLGGEPWSGRRVGLVALALLLFAVPPRFAALEKLSFRGDEETSAYPARSLLEGRGPTMPSGMEYRRALPQTWANAASARLFGAERELSYRLPAAVLGTLTVPLLFLFGRRYVGDPVALVGAVLLAVSQWHLVLSRMNRMYGPLLFFFILAAWAVWRWTETEGWWTLLGALAAFAAGVALHALAVLGAAFAVVPLAVPGWRRVSALKCLALGGIAGWVGLLYSDRYVATPYRQWRRLPALGDAEPQSLEPLPAMVGSVVPDPLWLLAVLGAGLGAWLAARLPSPDPHPGATLRRVALYLLAALGGLLAAIGHLYGAALAAFLFLYLHMGERRELVRRGWIPLLLLAGGGVAWTAWAIAGSGLKEGLKLVLSYPFPYPFFVGRQFPAVTLLAVGTAVWLALHPARPEERGVRACVLTAVAIFGAVGAVSSWGPNRYLIPAYPFLLLTAAYGLVLGAGYVLRRTSRNRAGPRPGMTVALAVVASGALVTHGIPQAAAVVTQGHGPPDGLLRRALATQPDHRGAGQFLRSAYREGDVVVAEDPLQQYWYAGRAEFWFRRYGDARQFLYVDGDGSLRDIYVSSRLLPSGSAVDSLLQSAGRVWLVTSGETFHNREHYLSEEQRRWLDSLERAREPTFVGDDDMTRVYCLNCDPAGEEPGRPSTGRAVRGAGPP